VIVTPTPIAGAFVLELEPIVDERGFFARAWCRQELGELGLVTEIAQCNLAHNARAGTLRGLHFQRPPHGEVKVVRCTGGAVHDVVVDLRPDSATHLGWFGIDLSADNRLAVYIPIGLAHGYQTLTDGAETLYLHSTPYAPGFDGGVRWDDPAFGIDWPDAPERIMSAKDRGWPDYDPSAPFF
jgi:dTDP-4-dehydrorhamnose 3,5-epimerase